MCFRFPEIRDVRYVYMETWAYVGQGDRGISRVRGVGFPHVRVSCLGILVTWTCMSGGIEGPPRFLLGKCYIRRPLLWGLHGGVPKSNIFCGTFKNPGRPPTIRYKTQIPTGRIYIVLVGGP